MAGDGKLATVFGGSGFVGRHIVWTGKRGYRVRAAVRRPDLAGHLQPMGTVGQIHAVQANLRFPRLGSSAPSRAPTSSSMPSEFWRPPALKPLKRCTSKAPVLSPRRRDEAGAERLVHISAIGADLKSRARYARTKAEGEEAVLAEFPSAIILRPSIVFGPEDEFFNRFASLARVSPVLPLIGGGTDEIPAGVCRRLGAGSGQRCPMAPAKPGTIYEIGGPQVLSFRDLLEGTLATPDTIGCLAPMPFWLAHLQALLTWPLPNALRPITVDQVRLLKSDNVVSEAAAREGRTLAALGVALPDHHRHDRSRIPRALQGQRPVRALSRRLKRTQSRPGEPLSSTRRTS